MNKALWNTRVPGNAGQASGRERYHPTMVLSLNRMRGSSPLVLSPKLNISLAHTENLS